MDDWLAEIYSGYEQGRFLMADSEHAKDLYWYDPDPRALLPIKDIHIPRRLRTKLLQYPYRITVNQAFTEVVKGCAETKKGRENTWINQDVALIFQAFHHEGLAHSIECWNKNGQLVGGIYGLTIGQIFCAESKFSRETDASKIALMHLCARLNHANFKILDIQFQNNHLKQFGSYEISRQSYHKTLQEHGTKSANFLSYQGLEDDLIKHFLNFKYKDG